MKNKQISLIEIAKVFLTVGTVGFGGGMAIIALMQDYCVKRNKWLHLDEFAHGIALGQFMGPFAVNAAIFVGYRLRGFVGGLVSSIAFLLPSVIFVIILSALYVHYQHIPSLQLALKSISPVVVALILSAAFQMGKGKLSSVEPIFLIIATVFLMIFLHFQVVAILLMALIYGFVKTKFFESEAL